VKNQVTISISMTFITYDAFYTNKERTHFMNSFPSKKFKSKAVFYQELVRSRRLNKAFKVLEGFVRRVYRTARDNCDHDIASSHRISDFPGVVSFLLQAEVVHIHFHFPERELIVKLAGDLPVARSVGQKHIPSLTLSLYR